MADKFSSAEDTCEGDDCEATTDVTYNVKKKKKLCDDCASKEGCIRKARKGGPNLYCKKHDEEIKLYCKTHGAALCYSCASIDHHQQHCVRQDIEDALTEKKAKLNGLKEKGEDKLQLCRAYGDQIRQCRQETDKHLQAIKHEVDSAINEAIKTDEDRKQTDAANINREIDEKNRKLKEEIQKNNEEREERLDLNNKNAEKRRMPINNKQRGLHSDIEVIAEVTERKIGKLEKSWQGDMTSAENTMQTLHTVLKDDRNLAKDGHHVNTSVTDALKKPLDVGGVKHINHIVSGVRLAKGDGREKYNGRIDWYDGEWSLIETINILDKITKPVIAGCTDDCNVMITDNHSDDSCRLNLNTNQVERVIAGTETSRVTSCALLNDDKVVCGNYHKDCSGDNLTGCITVYDRQWNLINDVTIPRNTEDDDTWVYVAAGQDGMIIAAEIDQSTIYVINPADGEITHIITCKEDMIMRGVLSSGNIIAQPCPAQRKVFIIDRESTQREVITHRDVILNVCIDPMTDDLYVVTSDDEYKTYVIEQVTSGGDMKKRSVSSFPLSTRLTELNNRGAHLVGSQVIMTKSGNIIACDGDSIFVFKKLFSL